MLITGKKKEKKKGVTADLESGFKEQRVAQWPLKIRKQDTRKKKKKKKRGKRTNLFPPMEIRARDVKPVHVRGQHAAEEQDAVEHAVPLEARDEGDGQRGEEDVDQGQTYAEEEASHLEFFNFFSPLGVWGLRLISRSWLGAAVVAWFGYMWNGLIFFFLLARELSPSFRVRRFMEFGRLGGGRVVFSFFPQSCPTQVCVLQCISSSSTARCGGEKEVW